MMSLGVFGGDEGNRAQGFLPLLFRFLFSSQFCRGLILGHSLSENPQDSLG